MTDIKQKIENYKFPEKDDAGFETELRKDLMNDFQIPQKGFSYEFKFKFVAAFASMLMIFFCIAIIKPSIIYSIHDLAFSKEQSDPVELLVEHGILKKNDEYVITKTSNHINKRKKITYIIEEYESRKDGTVTIISELDPLKNQRNRKLWGV